MSIRINNKNIDMNKIKKVRVDGHLVYGSEIDPKEPICITCTSGAVTVRGMLYSITGSLADTPNVEYSYDKVTWNTFYNQKSGSGILITLANVGDKVYLRNTANTLSDIHASFHVEILPLGDTLGRAKISGNVDSMINYSDLKEYCFKDLFRGNDGVFDASELLLPRRSVPNAAYIMMFEHCLNLIYPPKILAKSLDEWACGGMLEYTNIKVNENGTEGTEFFVCPTNLGENAVREIFDYTAGTFTGTPTPGNTYKYYD